MPKKQTVNQQGFDELPSGRLLPFVLPGPAATRMARILLVDDDDDFRRMLSDVFKDAGYQVQEASDGQQALELYRSKPAALVVADLVMPGKGGLVLIEQLKRLFPEAKIIAISGAGLSLLGDYLKKAAALGAKRVVSKPFSDTEILEVVGEVLDAARVDRQEDWMQ